MARKTTVVETVIDDMDGSTKGIETVAFALDGKSYEIDLGPKNAKAIRADLEKWTSHARKGARSAARGRRGAPRPTSDAAAIREWAKANGVEVPSRGRIPATVTEQYRAAK